MPRPRAPLLAVPLLATGPWLVGQIFRDSWWLTGLCFYLPSPALSAALAVAATIAWFRKQRRLARVSLLAACLPLLVTVGLENRWATRSVVDVPGELTLVHWNVCRGWLGWDKVRQRLLDLSADVYVLSELPANHRTDRVAWFGDGYSMIRDETLGIACKGFRHGSSERPPASFRLVFAVCQVGSQELGIMAVDLPASLWLARQPLLQEVEDWIEHFEPDLVVGDFNAPRRSLGLSSLPEGFTHAYDRAGSGWSYTWPVPFPVLAIDQCLLGPRVRPSRYSLDASPLSDHRIQTVRFSVGEH